MYKPSLVGSWVFAGALLSVLASSSSAHAGGPQRRNGKLPPPGSARKTESLASVLPASPTPFANDTKCGVTTYCGGPVMSAAEVITVYWTSQVGSAIRDFDPAKYSASLTDSAFMDQLSEYSTVGQTGTVCKSSDGKGGSYYFGPKKSQTTGQTITRGTADPKTYTITPTKTLGTTIDDDDSAIGVEILAQVKAGNLPPVTYDAQGYPNTIYFVYFPPNYTINQGGDASCGAFYAYHSSVTDPNADSACSGTYVPYAVIPDCNSDTAELSTAVSHELAEAISDADVGNNLADPDQGDGAWYLGPDYASGNPPSTCGEIGDVCANLPNSLAPVAGTTISAQRIWSEVQKGCHTSNAAVSAKDAVPGGACGGHDGADAGASPGSAADASTGATPTESGTPSSDAGAPVSTNGSASGDAGDGANASADNGDGASQSSGCSAAPSGSSSGPFAIVTSIVVSLARGRRRRR